MFTHKNVRLFVGDKEIVGAQDITIQPVVLEPIKSYIKIIVHIDSQEQDFYGAFTPEDEKSFLKAFENGADCALSLKFKINKEK